MRLQAHVQMGPRAQIARRHPMHAEAPPGEPGMGGARRGLAFEMVGIGQQELGGGGAEHDQTVHRRPQLGRGDQGVVGGGGSVGDRVDDVLQKQGEHLDAGQITRAAVADHVHRLGQGVLTRPRDIRG